MNRSFSFEARDVFLLAALPILSQGQAQRSVTFVQLCDSQLGMGG